MKYSRVLILLFALLSITSIVTGDYIVDAFDASYNATLVLNDDGVTYTPTDRVRCAPSQIFRQVNGQYGDLRNYVQNKTFGNATVQIYPDAYCTQTFAAPNVMGGFRRILINTITSDINYTPQGNAGLYVSDGILGYSVGSDLPASLSLAYMGNRPIDYSNCSLPQVLCSNPYTDVGPYITPGIDVTENGRNQALQITANTDHPGTFILITVWSSTQRSVVVAATGPTAAKKRSADEPAVEADEGHGEIMYGQNIPLATRHEQSLKRFSENKHKRGGGPVFTIILPFARFARGFDFTDVRGMQITIPRQVALDASFTDVRFIPLVQQTKTGVVVDSIVSDGVAQPGETVNFTIRVNAIANAVNINNLLFFDNPNSYDNYATYIPSSLVVTGFLYSTFNCSNTTANGYVCAVRYIQDSTAFNRQNVVLANGSLAYPNQIAFVIPVLTTGSYFTVQYSMVVNNMLCAIPTCPSTPQCQVSGQQQASAGRCLCTRDTGYVCLQETTPLITIPQLQNISALSPNQSQAIFARCGATTDVTTQTTVTSLPIGSIPNPAVYVNANPTDKANGVLPGASTTFTITLQNNRTRSSDSFNLYISYDSNLVCTAGANSPNPTFTTDSQGRIYRAFSSGLPAQATPVVIAFTCNVSSSLGCNVNATVLTATIDFSSIPNNICAEDITADDVSSDTVPLIGSPSLAITKANAGTITLGSNTTNLASFTITVRNTGTRTASNVAIIDTVPAALASVYQSGDNTAWTSIGNNQYSFTITSLTAGASQQLTFNYRIPSTASDCVTGSYSNTASVSGTCGGSANATASVNFVAVPDLAVSIGTATITGGNVATPNSVVCWPITYQNLGYRVASSAVMNVILPASTTFNAGQSSSGFTAVSGTNNYSLTVSNVAALSSPATVNFCVNVNANISCGSNIATSVSVAVNCPGFPEVNTANNAASSTNVPISASVTLSLSKTASVTSIVPGSTVAYTIRGTNSGNSQATGVTITESVPSGFTAGSNPSWTLGSNGLYSFAVGTVAAGTSFGPVTFNIVAPSTVVCPPPSTTNTASVTETCTGATANASLTLPFTASPTLGLTAQNTSTVVLANSNQVCVVGCYTNTGNQNAANSTLTLTTPQYTTFVASSGWTNNAGSLTYNIGNIAVGASVCAPQACFTVQSPIPCGVNSVQFTFTLASPCAPTQTRTANTVAPIVANPVFTITKSNNLNGTDARPGSSITYTIRYANVGLRIPTDVVLTENIPQYLVAGSNPAWTCSGSVCRINVGTLSPAQGVQTVSFTGTVSSAVNGRVIINNTATISSTVCPASAQATSIVNVAGFPNLVITKTDAGITVSPGEFIYYTIGYSNVGDSSADRVTINEIVPSFTYFDSSLSSSGWSCANGAGAGTQCVYTIGVLAPGQTGQVRFVVHVDDWVRCGIDTLTNVATIQSLNPLVVETSYTDNSAVEVTPLEGKPDLVITKETNRTQGARYDRAGAGDLIVYNITFSNVGVRDGLDVVIYETVPEYTVFDAAESSPEWNCSNSAAGSLCTFSLGQMYPTMMGMDSTMRIQFAVRVIDDLPPWAHVTNNCVMINNTCDDCNPFNNMACYPVTLYGVPDLAINQTAYCEAIHWYVEWSNQGDQAANNVVITDFIPAESTFDNVASDSRWSCNTQVGSINFGQCTINVGSLNSGAGGSAVFVTHPISGSALTTFTNRASASGSGNNPDPTPDNNSDSATVGYEGCPDSCDSCCPTVDECCPDKTEVVFQFGGLLNGIDRCNA